MIIVNESRMLSDIFFILFDTPIDEETFNTELSYHNFRKNGIPFRKFISKNGKENTAQKYGVLFLSSGYEKDGFAVLIDGFELS